MKTTTFETAKVGDEVWDIRQGWGKIRSICKDPDNLYPVNVEFPSLVREEYTVDGMIHRLDINQSLFWSEVKIEAPQKPLPKLEVDTKVIVWNRGVGKTKRHFSHFTSEGKIACFDYGKTSWTIQNTKNTTEWNMWELAELQPLSENQ